MLEEEFHENLKNEIKDFLFRPIKFNQEKMNKNVTFGHIKQMGKISPSLSNLQTHALCVTKLSEAGYTVKEFKIS